MAKATKTTATADQNWACTGDVVTWGGKTREVAACGLDTQITITPRFAVHDSGRVIGMVDNGLQEIRVYCEEDHDIELDPEQLETITKQLSLKTVPAGLSTKLFASVDIWWEMASDGTAIFYDSSELTNFEDENGTEVRPDDELYMSVVTQASHIYRQLVFEGPASVRRPSDEITSV